MKQQILAKQLLEITAKHQMQNLKLKKFKLSFEVEMPEIH
jgi:hypothetical protein